MKPFILMYLFFGSILINAQVIKKDSNTVKENYKIYCITQNDGTKLIGKIIESNPREVTFKTTDGRDIIVPQYIIKSILEVKTDDFNLNGEYVGKDNFCTRYFLTTNGLPIQRGNNYTQWNLLGADVQFHIDDHLGAGIMSSWFGTPLIGTIKYSNKISDDLHYAVGGLIGTGSWVNPDFGGALPFVALTLGDGRKNINISAGYGAIWNEGNIDGQLLFSIAGITKFTKRVSFVFDSFILPNMSTSPNRGFSFNGFGIFVPGIRIHNTETAAFQFGFGGLYTDGMFLRVPIPILQWFRSF